MKYENGDVVKLKPWQPEFEDFGYGTTDEMVQWFDTHVTIYRADPDGFVIIDDGKEWSWEYGWIQEVEPITLPEELFTI